MTLGPRRGLCNHMTKPWKLDVDRSCSLLVWSAYSGNGRQLQFMDKVRTVRFASA
jgi:hypothetical protein